MFLLWLYFSHFCLDKNVNVSIVKRCPSRSFFFGGGGVPFQFFFDFGSEAINLQSKCVKTALSAFVIDLTHRDTEYLP